MFENAIKKWWFYVFALILAFIPSITQKSVPPDQIPLLIKEVLQNPLAYRFPIFFPIVKILIISILVGTLFFKDTFKKVFPLFFIILLAVISVFQNISLNTQFGYALLLGNLLIQGLVVFSWIYEIRVQHNKYSKINIKWWKIVCLILGFFAFWMPASNGLMRFSLIDFFINEAGLTYCMITPVILSFLFLYYPNVNKVTLRITSIAGLYFGIMNMITWFVLNTEYWWMGVIHLPLLINSMIGLILSIKIKARTSYNNG